VSEVFYRKIVLVSLAVAVAALPYSTLVCQAGLLVFLISWLLEGRWAEKRQLLEQHPLVWLLPAFFLLHFVGLWYTDNLKLGWANLDKKIFLALVPIALASTRPFNKWEINTVFGTFIVSLLVGTVVCIGHSFSFFVSGKPVAGLFAPSGMSTDLFAGGFWAYFSHVGLASGISLHPTYFALYLSLCLLILIYVYRDNADDLTRRERIVIYAIFSYFSLFIVFLGSKLLSVATIVIVIFAATRFITRASRASSIMVVSAVAVAIISFVFINPFSRINRWEELLIAPVAASDSARPEGRAPLSFWALGNPVFQKINPVFGAGTGDVAHLMREPGIQPGKVSNYDPHNQFVHTLMALGVVGLATLLIVMVVPVYFAYRKKYFLFSAFVSLFFLVCLTESALEATGGIVFFAVFNSLFLFQQKGLQHVSNDEVVFA